MSLGICDEMNHSVELRLEASGRAFGLVNVCSQLFWRNKWKLVHVGAFIVLRKSVEVIFSCRLLPVTPYTQVRFRFFDLNCCHLRFFDVKLAILFRH